MFQTKQALWDRKAKYLENPIDISLDKLKTPHFTPKKKGVDFIVVKETNATVTIYLLEAKNQKEYYSWSPAWLKEEVIDRPDRDGRVQRIIDRALRENKTIYFEKYQFVHIIKQRRTDNAIS